MSGLTVADLGTIKHMRGKRTNPTLIANTFGFASVAALLDAVLDIAEPSAAVPAATAKAAPRDRAAPPPSAALDTPPPAPSAGASAPTPPEPVRIRVVSAPPAPPSAARPVSPERTAEENLAALAATAVASGAVTVTKCPPAKLGRTGRMVLARRGRAPAVAEAPKGRDTSRKARATAEPTPGAAVAVPAPAEAAPPAVVAVPPVVGAAHPSAPPRPAPAPAAKRPSPLQLRRAAATPPTGAERAAAQDLAELARQAAAQRTVPVTRCPTVAAALTDGAKISAEDAAALQSHIAACTGKAA